LTVFVTVSTVFEKGVTASGFYSELQGVLEVVLREGGGDVSSGRVGFKRTVVGEGLTQEECFGLSLVFG
jgi:hypothetical protein